MDWGLVVVCRGSEGEGEDEDVRTQDSKRLQPDGMRYDVRYDVSFCVLYP